jgi:hypothetical protein
MRPNAGNPADDLDVEDHIAPPASGRACATMCPDRAASPVKKRNLRRHIACSTRRHGGHDVGIGTGAVEDVRCHADALWNSSGVSAPFGSTGAKGPSAWRGWNLRILHSAFPHRELPWRFVRPSRDHDLPCLAGRYAGTGADYCRLGGTKQNTTVRHDG